jgi:hypothetical protein
MKKTPFIIILIITGFFTLDLLSNKPAIRNYCKATREYVSLNSEVFHKITTDIFDHAKSCGNGEQCKKEINRQIYSILPSSFSNLEYPESTYFIRINEQGLIEKMFYSGEYYAKTPETFREKFVLWRLKQSKGVCDLGWKNDISTTSMTYLRDIVAEAEIIIPIDQTDAAIVRLWGD